LNIYAVSNCLNPVIVLIKSLARASNSSALFNLSQESVQLLPSHHWPTANVNKTAIGSSNPTSLSRRNGTTPRAESSAVRRSDGLFCACSICASMKFRLSSKKALRSVCHSILGYPTPNFSAPVRLAPCRYAELKSCGRHPTKW
jgi:hypothetical protein